MSRFRKIDIRIWNDSKFRDLSDDGKLVFFFVMTHPSMTALGAMRATLPGLAAEMGWDTERLLKAFGEAFAKGMVEHDHKACFVGLPNFLKYNGPESPNVVKAWTKSLDLLPECDLKTLTIQRASSVAKGLTEGFAKALPEAFEEAFAKGMLIQEKEQEQEPELEQEPLSRAAKDNKLGASSFKSSDQYQSPNLRESSSNVSQVEEDLIKGGVSESHLGDYAYRIASGDIDLQTAIADFASKKEAVNAR